MEVVGKMTKEERVLSGHGGKGEVLGVGEVYDYMRG
jgi:hypothetical protein